MWFGLTRSTNNNNSTCIERLNIACVLCKAKILINNIARNPSESRLDMIRILFINHLRNRNVLDILCSYFRTVIYKLKYVHVYIIFKIEHS